MLNDAMWTDSQCVWSPCSIIISFASQFNSSVIHHLWAARWNSNVFRQWHCLLLNLLTTFRSPLNYQVSVFNLLIYTTLCAIFMFELVAIFLTQLLDRCTCSSYRCRGLTSLAHYRYILITIMQLYRRISTMTYSSKLFSVMHQNGRNNISIQPLSRKNRAQWKFSCITSLIDTFRVSTGEATSQLLFDGRRAA